MKVYFYLFLSLALFLFLGCTDSTTNKGEPYNYLGNQTTDLLKVNQPSQLKTDLNTNTLLKNTTQPVLSFISTSEILHNLPSQYPFYFSTNGDTKDAAIVFTKAVDTISFSIDSIPNISVIKNTVNESQLNTIVLKKDTLYSTVKDSVAIFSTSENSLLAILKQEENKLSAATTYLLAISQEAEVAQIRSSSLYPERLSPSKDVNTSKELSILPDGIQVTGIVKSKDSSIIDVFKGQIPQKSKAPLMLPSNFLTANGFTFSDAQNLINNLKKQRQDSATTTVHPLLETLTEITEVDVKEGKALLMASIDIEQSLSTIELDLLQLETYRDITIYENNVYQLISASFSPLISPTEYPFLVLLDNFVICTNTLAAAKEMIGTGLNKNVLETTLYYNTLNTQLLSTSSLYSLGQGARVSEITNAVLQTDIAVKDRKKYPLAVLQYSYEKSFAHLNFVTKEINTTTVSTGTVSQKFSAILNENILGSPQFFSNHRTKGKDVIAQDLKGTLHLFSINGKKLWSKKLDNEILGEIKEVDLLRNGKKQLAFATKNALHILDRNGKPVAPFPLTFKDDITQPLAVFDYDNNRKYRFIVTQGSSLFMYDSKGKSVKGFTFKKTKTPLVFPPEHIRIGNKDFIILAEENGKATFLSRTGKERIKVNETFNFGAIGIQKEGNKFIIISEDKKKHTITASGKLTTKAIAVSESYSFATQGKNKVTLDDNLLRVNNVLIELPFGIYSTPSLITHRKNTYVAVTDLQEHKVYVYDDNNSLIKGFPVFGMTEPTLASSGKKLYLVTTGSDKEVLCYQVK